MVMQEVSVSGIPDVRAVWESLPWREKVSVFFGRTVAIGRYHKKGWPEKSEFFIFRCRRCGRLNVDYCHGYRQRLDCIHCGLSTFVAKSEK